MKKSTKNTIRTVAIGAGIAAAAGIAALTLKDNPKVKKATAQIKKDLMVQAKKAKAVTKTAYTRVAKDVIERHKKAIHKDAWAVLDIAKEVEDAWKLIKKSIQK